MDKQQFITKAKNTTEVYFREIYKKLYNLASFNDIQSYRSNFSKCSDDGIHSSERLLYYALLYRLYSYFGIKEPIIISLHQSFGIEPIAPFLILCIKTERPIIFTIVLSKDSYAHAISIAYRYNNKLLLKTVIDSSLASINYYDNWNYKIFLKAEQAILSIYDELVIIDDSCIFDIQKGFGTCGYYSLILSIYCLFRNSLNYNELCKMLESNHIFREQHLEHMHEIFIAFNKIIIYISSNINQIDLMDYILDTSPTNLIDTYILREIDTIKKHFIRLKYQFYNTNR